MKSGLKVARPLPNHARIVVATYAAMKSGLKGQTTARLFKLGA